MNSEISAVFGLHGIEYAGAAGMNALRVINEGLFERTVSGFAENAIVFLVPYRAPLEEERNLSVYAVPRDYHLYMKELFGAVIPVLSTLYPGKSFRGMSDHSPIDETHAAAVCGLGVIGDNKRLINEKYGSYVFIGEIFTDADIERTETRAPGECLHCGACAAACPAGFGNECLSAVTQRKGKLTPEEQTMIRRTGTAWGCDVCQKVCPMNEGKEFTQIPFFKEALLCRLTSGELESMTDGQFRERAYSWRGREVIRRNLGLLEI